MPSEKEKTLQVLGLSLKLGLLFAPNERSRHIRPNTEEMFIKKDVLKSKKFRNKNPNYDDGKDCFYVGQTSLTPEERFEVHKEGGRLANTFVYKHWKCLRRNKYKRYNPITTKEISLLVEKHLAEKLRSEGYGVWCN